MVPNRATHHILQIAIANCYNIYLPTLNGEEMEKWELNFATSTLKNFVKTLF